MNDAIAENLGEFKDFIKKAQRLFKCCAKKNDYLD